MPKFKFYIVDIDAGDIYGTNDVDLAREYAQVDESYVIDTENNKWLFPDGYGDQDIDEAKTSISMPNDEEDDE